MSFLEKNKLNTEDLLSGSPLPTLEHNDFTVGLVLDLYHLAVRSKLPLKNSLYRWISELSGVPANEISEIAFVSKIYRIINWMKTRRLSGASKESYLKGPFIVPSQVPSASSTSFESSKSSGKSEHEKETGFVQGHSSVHTTEQLDIVTEKLLERRDTVIKVRETAKQLKRKLDRTEKKLDLKQSKLETTETDLKKSLSEAISKNRDVNHLKSLLAKSKANSLILRSTIRDLRTSEIQQGWNNKLKDTEINHLRAKISENDEILKRAKGTENQLREANENIDYLQLLLNDNAEIPLFDTVAQKYTTDTVECVMNLTDLKVPSEKVGEVIKAVATLCGKTVNRVPAPSTVNRIVDSKIAVAQKQIASTLKDKPDTTLYTDETRKYGRSLQSYIVTDEESNSYLLGLREMVDKSGQSTLDTLKEIINDISTYCHEKEQQNDMNVGYKILSNVRDTMSDRASTEKHFNQLLEQYRSDILPYVCLGWEDMSEEEKNKMTRMNNFFCGLHLLVGMADVCENSMKKFERQFLDGKDVGSAVKPELKKYHRNESGTLRLLRTSSKAFAVGQDEKSGVNLPWHTYLKTKHEKNLIMRFKHNRFNLVFSLALAVYHHRNRISQFLDEIHGTDNDLLKAVSLDIKEDLFIAGLKAFGLISKFITGPLWKLLEESGHILDMNIKYKVLVDFLQQGSNSVELITKFAVGEETPFQTRLTDDVATQSLMEENRSTEILYPLLQALFLSMYELLNRMVADHLPGGKFFAPSEELIRETRSAMRHNKLPEFIFGQLDQLLRYRPNATLLTNESYLMYSHNKSRKWLAELPSEEKERLLEDCRKEGKVIRQQFKVRLQEIEAKRLEIQEQKRRQMVERERKRLRNLEEMTKDICFYGLWQNEQQLIEGMALLGSDAEKREALHSQLRFRKSVLHQKHQDKQIYNFTRRNEQGKYIKLSLEQLKQNLLLLIEDTLLEPTHEKETKGIPLLVGRDIHHTFSNGKTYRGSVISVVPGFREWYNVKYENDEAIYAYNLKQDYKEGNLKIVVGETQTD